MKIHFQNCKAFVAKIRNILLSFEYIRKENNHLNLNLIFRLREELIYSSLVKQILFCPSLHCNQIFILLCKILVATEISVLVVHWLPWTILFKYINSSLSRNVDLLLHQNHFKLLIKNSTILLNKTVISFIRQELQNSRKAMKIHF
jgi:hypothetical protein